ncbi:hypothetical protein NN3_07520 [Nocardia neocaledoniensis NBRC 108232]|uniref:hypothetical protein n=1 Tax=Nocardia neocaledoniensis TaxID=236511 RepID=UPI00119462DA|nr:hypothetical protein [Nocardia neocaledoniensis]GEM29745.1 hypothetical protein NN3_07520 [Nocardia neocaledoniensis NBRC 108232]
MAGDDGQSVFSGMIEQARVGSLNLRMEPEEFARIDRECTEFQTTIGQIQQSMTDISKIATWGFGDHANSGLSSARVMADRFRTKARGGEDSFYDVLEEHYKIVEDIRVLHQVIRDRFMAEDEAWAARFNAEVAALDAGGSK